MYRTEQDYVQSLQLQMAEIKAREEEVRSMKEGSIKKAIVMLQAASLEKQHSSLLQEQIELDRAVRTIIQAIHLNTVFMTTGGGEKTT